MHDDVSLVNLACSNQLFKNLCNDARVDLRFQGLHVLAERCFQFFHDFGESFAPGLFSFRRLCQQLDHFRLDLCDASFVHDGRIAYLQFDVRGDLLDRDFVELVVLVLSLDTETGGTWRDSNPGPRGAGYLEKGSGVLTLHFKFLDRSSPTPMGSRVLATKPPPSLSL
jgi:hypothetical protein